MKKKIFYKLIISYSSILLFALLINFFAFYNYQRDIAAQSEIYNRVFLDQIQFTFDEQIRNINGIIDNIRVHPSVINLMFTGDEQDRYSRYAAFLLIHELRNLINIHDFVDSIVIVYKDFDIFVTGASVYYSFEEFRALYNHMYWNAESWDTLFDEIGLIRYSGLVMEDGKYIYTVIRPIMLRDARVSSAYVMINFRNDFLKHHIQDIIDLQYGLMYISDKEGNLIMSEGSLSLLEYASTISPEYSSPIPVTISGRRYMQYHSFSQNEHLMYVFILPVESFLSRGINRLLVVLFVGTILFGGVLCFAIASHNARPITKLTEFIAQKNLLPGNNLHHDELEYIRSAVDTAVREYSDIQNEFTRYIPMMQTSMVADILKGNLEFRAELDKGLEALGIEFPCDWYGVVLIEYHGDGSKTLVEYNLINIQLRNLIYDYFADNGLVYTCDLDMGMMACLLNLNYNMKSKADEIREDMKNLIRHLNEVYEVTITVTASRFTNNFCEISKLYNEATDAMTHQLFNAPGFFTFFSELQFDQESYSISNADQHRIMVNLRAGNVDDVMETITRIIENIRNGPAMPHEYVKFTYLDLLRLLQKTSINLNIDTQKLYDETEYNPFEAILRSKNVNIMQELIIQLYYKTAVEIQKRIEDLKVPLKDELLIYINKNFKNPDLSLSIVAEHFNLNLSYLSSYFKKSTGENFVKYVNSLRLENGRKLLEESDLQISDIAAEVGYSNSSIFISNFKKAYGVTPGAYRSNTLED